MADITNRDRLGWQRDAHAAQGEFLATAIELDLPAVTWTIAVSGALVGDVDSLTTAPAAMRATFSTWSGVLGAAVTPERVDSSGTAHLYAQFVWSKNDLVRGAIRATIHPPFDADGGGL
ncbi:hypothetical protein [Streptomyces europaeiscabiei]|uniref:hypothetical protein n=1 Tax=Streptomyces europaeiscabiei TaxID=146819 RepID=UPI0029BCC179|nr:hypothetical protein [Streptomyces europaeiscabiei]MDX2757862.1 hypothetical protein [Streptomyces europaeiscabiei]